MHVLHVMEATIGGTRRHLVDVAAGLLAHGITVTLAVSAEREPAFRADLAHLQALGCRVFEIPMVRALAPARDYAHLRRLSQLLRDLTPDIVHTHSSKAGVLGRLASLDTGVGLRVHTPHTFAFLFRAMFSPLKRRLFREIEAQLAGETQRILAVSESEAETFRASGVVAPERVRVVPNGIDAAPFLAAQPHARAEFGVPDGAPLVAVAGLLNVAKGQDLLLRALADTHLVHLHALVIGHGEMRAELEQLAHELDLTPRVRFLGWRDDLAAVLKACDALVLPSRWEGMPYVLLEAMACGLPVVATASDGAREVVQDGVTGFLVPQEDPDALARGLRQLFALSPERRAALGAAGRERVRAHYTRERMLEQLLAAYRELVP